MMVWTQLGLAGAFGGLLALERRAFLQAMFSRPLVSATLMGLVLDDVQGGLFVGMLLELFHLGSASLGAALPENDTLAATGTASAAAAMGHGAAGSTPALWSLSILLFVGLGPMGRWFDRFLERYTRRLSQRAQAQAELGELTRAVRKNLWGMWPYFALFGLATSLCYAVGYAIGQRVHALPYPALRGLAWAYPAMASVAAAFAARGSHAKRAAIYAAGTAAVVIVIAAAYRELW